MITRRALIVGATAALAAPAIVRAASLMPVRTMLWTPPLIEIQVVTDAGNVLGRTAVRSLQDIATMAILHSGAIGKVLVMHEGHEVLSFAQKPDAPVCPGMFASVNFSPNELLPLFPGMHGWIDADAKNQS